jgi:hypothetical protein
VLWKLQALRVVVVQLLAGIGARAGCWPGPSDSTALAPVLCESGATRVPGRGRGSGGSRLGGSCGGRWGVTTRTTDEIRLQQREIVLIGSTRRRLHVEDVICPPGTSGPPCRAHPHIRVGRQVVKHACDSGLAHAVGASSELANDTFLTIGLQPLCGGLHALLADGGAHAGGRRAGPVGVEILVHLVDDLILRVGEGLEVVVDGGPGPRAGPRVALDENVLRRGACSTDGVDGSLVEVEHERLVHVMVLVVYLVSLSSRHIKPDGNILVSKMTWSLDANWAARVFQNAAKSSVDEMMFP